METTRLSSKGQVIIPKPFRSAHQWETGQELEVIDTGEGVLLKPKRVFPETKIEDVAGCLKYTGKRKSLKDMEEGIAKGVAERFGDRR